MRATGLGVLCLGLVGGLAACDPVEAQPTAVSGATWEDVRIESTRTEIVLVLTADPSLQASTLREELPSALAGAFEQWFEAASPAVDPSAWRHIDWVVWMTHPSASGSARWLDPITLRTDELSGGQIDALLASVSHRLASLSAGPGPYRPMVATRDAVTLLTGQRSPRDARESGLLAQLEGDGGLLPATRRSVLSLVVSARDDEGQNAPESLALLPQGERLTPLTLIVPSSEEECASGDFPRDVFFPRLEAWATASEPAEAYGWPCGQEPLAQGGWLTSTGGASFCSSRPLLARWGGEVVCRAWVENLPAGPSCAAYGRGWVEPGPEAPPTADCEIPQLTGEAGERCRLDAECAGCGDGFCQADAMTWRELHPHEHCAGRVPARLRFVGGAFASTVRVRCALDTK